MREPDQRLADFMTAFGAEEVTAQPNRGVDFYLAAVPGFAYVKDGEQRIRGSIFLDELDDGAEARAWVARQPQPEASVLEVARVGETWLLRILFERHLDAADLDEDPLYEEVKVYASAWDARVDVEVIDHAEPFRVTGDPVDLSPQNAWLLLGDEASFPSPSTLRSDAARGALGVFEWEWTTSKLTQTGDLVFFYFTAPRKAVHFVARAASRAFFSRDIPVNAQRAVANEQWWGYFTAPIEIEPIPYETLRGLAAGHLLLRGRSGVYLRSDLVDGLTVLAKDPADQAQLERIVRTPTGLSDLPAPAMMTLDEWSRLGAGALALEKQVEQHIVEPLLNFALAGTSFRWERQYRIGPGIADYAILGPDKPACVVEAKLAVRLARDADWTNCKDFQQARRYAADLGCRAMLIDANRIYLIDAGADAPYTIIERSQVSQTAISTIAAHLTQAPI